jgi:hypothetical protein
VFAICHLVGLRIGPSPAARAEREAAAPVAAGALG